MSQICCCSLAGTRACLACSNRYYRDINTLVAKPAPPQGNQSGYCALPGGASSMVSLLRDQFIRRHRDNTCLGTTLA
jgi:hypothetical protein